MLGSAIGRGGATGVRRGRRVLAENLDAELDALVADVSRLSGDQLFTCHCHLPQNEHLQSGGKWESTNHEEYRVDRPMLAPLRLARRVHAAQPPAVTLSTSCCHARHFGGGIFQRPGLDRGAEPKNRVSLCSMSDRDVAVMMLIAAAVIFGILVAPLLVWELFTWVG